MNDEEKDEMLEDDLQPNPIEGQIGIEELYVRDEEPVEEEPQYIEPIDGQIDFESFTTEYEAEMKNSVSDDTSQQDNYDGEEDDSFEDMFLKEESETLDKLEENESIEEKDEVYNTEPEQETDLINDVENEDLSEEQIESVNYVDKIGNQQEELEFVEQEAEEKSDVENLYEEETQESNNYQNNLEELEDNGEEEYVEENLLDKEAKEIFEEDVKNDENELKEDQELQEEDREALDKFFDTEEEIEKTQEELEKEELDKFFDVKENEEDQDKKEDLDDIDEEDDGFDVFLNEDIDKKENFKVDEENKELEKEVKSLASHAKPRKSLMESESAFINTDNADTVRDVDDINKNIKDVDVNVGRDVFADYASNSIDTQEVQEKEVSSIIEKVVSENSGQDVVDGMLYKNIDTVLHESMIPYSEHVILDRALPRVEDGLKPVQRRILYSMYELGVTPDKPFRKSARIVGDCLGKYHPHGDKSVYDAMVRMAQPFNTNELLVSGHGNFGSVDGDGAAAMRYTEARLAPLAMELLRDLDKNTVKWGLNFDDTLKEPEMLPGRFPNLLVNGTTGIAVGLATNIPPHNLGETIDGVVAYINKPTITLKEMLRIIKGPDFPTGGYILNNSEIVQAYETGKGKIYMRAKMHIETNGADKRYIVITEMPYQVNKSSLLQKINVFREEGKYGFDAISEVRDESDRDGMRAVIRLKKDADLKTVYESLLKNTELQGTFGINMVAIANGKPKQMGLLDIISYYAEYQREIVLRRSKYEYDQAKEREHILSGLIIAIKNIDAVVKIIKTSKNTTEAKKRLRDKFVLSERQAQAILDMRLARLTSLEVYKLEEELKKLRELIKKLYAIINSKKLQFEVVKEEMLQIKKQYKSERKTRVMRTDETLKIESSEPKPPVSQNVVILKSAQNNFKCLNSRQFSLAQKEVNASCTLNDLHTIKFETESTKTLLAFSSLGNCFKVDVKNFPECRYKDKGGAERAIFKELAANETIVALFDFEDTNGKENIIFLTKAGMIKKTALSEYGLLKKYFQAMKLKEDDEIISIVKEPEKYDVVFVTSQGMVLRAENGDIPIQGRISGGVKGINLSNKDFVVGASLCGEKGEVLAVTNKGFAKRVSLKNIDKMARYRKGLKLFSFSGDNGNCLLYGDVVGETYSLFFVDTDGENHVKSTDLISIEARIGKGKQMDKLKKSTSVNQIFASRV